MRAWFDFFCLGVLLCGACSRSENSASSRGAAPTPVASSAEPALGPIADPSSEAALGPRVDPSNEAASALPLSTAEALLERIRKSGNKGVVVTAFASWCDPCREELPLLEAAAPKIKKRGVPIWVVSMDEPDAVPAAKSLLDSLHVTLPAFAASPTLQAFKVGLNPNWPGMIPASFLFDASGKLRYFWAGEVYEKELLPVVEGFLAGKHIDGTSDFGNAPGATEPGHD
ncbi:MAG TPA: TlpA disulfide reductase family protein [Polyangiaceae bacterium]|jgi:peroxiredoxin|nr:TlpA disulfide reductase family protein [Polyangiaceae bacterium]